MKLPQMFDATQHNPDQSSFDQIPVGIHHVTISDSEYKQSKSNEANGYVELTLEVADGVAQGAKGPLRLNLNNSSEKAVELARRDLSAICHAIGVFKVEDTAQLHGRPFSVEVANQPLTADQQARADAGEEVKPFTKIKKILNFDGSAPAQGGQSQTPVNQPPAESQQQGNAPQASADTGAQQAQAAGSWEQKAPAGSAPAATPTTPSW